MNEPVGKSFGNTCSESQRAPSFPLYPVCRLREAGHLLPKTHHSFHFFEAEPMTDREPGRMMAHFLCLIGFILNAETEFSVSRTVSRTQYSPRHCLFTSRSP